MRGNSPFGKAAVGKAPDRIAPLLIRNANCVATFDHPEPAQARELRCRYLMIILMPSECGPSPRRSQVKVPEIMRVSNSPSFLVSDLQEVYFMHDREHITDPEVLGRIRGIVGGAGRLGRVSRALRLCTLGS